MRSNQRKRRGNLLVIAKPNSVLINSISSCSNFPELTMGYACPGYSAHRTGRVRIVKTSRLCGEVSCRWIGVAHKRKFFRRRVECLTHSWRPVHGWATGSLVPCITNLDQTTDRYSDLVAGGYFVVWPTEPTKVLGCYYGPVLIFFDAVITTRYPKAMAEP